MIHISLVLQSPGREIRTCFFNRREVKFGFASHIKYWGSCVLNAAAMTLMPFVFLYDKPELGLGPDYLLSCSMGLNLP